MRKKIFCVLLFLFACVSICIYIIGNFSKGCIAIIGAMDVEIQEIYLNLENRKSFNKNDFKIFTGKIGQYNIVLAKSGVGKVSAATTTQFIIDKYNPKYIVNIGIAGSLNDNLKTGNVLIAKKMVQHDFDVTAFGNPKGYIDNDIDPDKPTFFYSDEYLVNKFLNKLRKDINSGIIKIGTIATGDIFVDDASQKEIIRKEFGADAVDMESAAIAQTAQRNNVPVIILRTISDTKEDNTNSYKQNKRESARQSALKILAIITN